MLISKENYDVVLEFLLKKNKNGSHDEVIKTLEKATDLVVAKDKLKHDIEDTRNEVMRTFTAMRAATPDQKKKLNEKIKKLSVKIDELEKQQQIFSRV
jgi:hemoglobin-like flavoprotein